MCGLVVLDDFFLHTGRMRKSEIFVWDRNSYLTHVISPKKETFRVNSVV